MARSGKQTRKRQAAASSGSFQTKDDVANPEAQAPSSADEERRARISARAYELYRQCGCRDGHDLDHWLEAEREEAERRADKGASLDEAARR